MAEESEPPIREFADRAVLSLLESPQNLRGVVQIVAAEIAERLDFSRAQRLNRSFIPEDLRKQEADLLYRIPFLEGTSEVWVYLLLEHQSRPDRTMGLRLLSYMVQLWETQRRGWQDARTPVSKWRLHPIIPIVFYSGKHKWTSPISLRALMDVPDLLVDFVPAFRTLLLKLQGTPPTALTGSAVALALRTLQAADEPAEELARVLREVVEALERLPEEAKPEWQRALGFVYRLIQHKRVLEEQGMLIEAVEDSLEPKHRAEAKELEMTGAQALKAEGRKEGRIEGRREGQRELFLRLAEAKFGPLSDTQVTALNALTERQVDDLAIRLLTATSLEELGI